MDWNLEEMSKPPSEVTDNAQFTNTNERSEYDKNRTPKNDRLAQNIFTARTPFPPVLVIESYEFMH